MSDEESLLTLTLAVNGKSLPPLQIKRSDEEAVRAAAKQINTRIEQNRIRFGNELKADDIMAMTAIEALAKKYSLENKNDTKPFEDKIHSLISELDDYLKK